MSKGRRCAVLCSACFFYMVTTRYLTLADLDAVKQIADQNRASLGFINRGRFIEAADKHACLVAVENDYVVGFVIFHHRKRDLQTTLYDICVRASHRRQGVGTILVQALIDECRSKRRTWIVLKCPDGSPANQFYSAIGFEHVAVVKGRVKDLHVWEYSVK